MGAEAGEVAEEGRSPSQESCRSEADVASNEEKVIRSYEETVGCEEEGWRKVFVEELAAINFALGERHNSAH
jgi:hypothetical protein